MIRYGRQVVPHFKYPIVYGSEIHSGLISYPLPRYWYGTAFQNMFMKPNVVRKGLSSLVLRTSYQVCC